MALGDALRIGTLADALSAAKKADKAAQEETAHYEVSLDPDRSLDLLGALGIEVFRQSGDEVLSLCPMHKARTGKDDHDPSWNFNVQSGLSMCFSCGYAANAVRLVADVRDLRTKHGAPDWDAAAEWLRDFEVDLQTKVSQSRIGYRRGSDDTVKAVPMSEARLALFDTAPPTWALRERKIDQEACARYGVLWDPETGCWITPLREADTGKLIGFQQKGQGHRYFRNRPPGMKKSLTLFGLDAWEGGTMVVVESPLDCLRLDALGITGGVSTCGAAISESQVDLMGRADHVLLALDNDAAGFKALLSFEKLAKGRAMSWSGLNYSRTDKKDVGDMSDREVVWAVDHAISGVLGSAAISEGRPTLKLR